MSEATVVRSRRIDAGEPLFLYDPPEDSIDAYVVFTSVCDNPECTCTRMYLDIRPAEGTSGGEIEVRGPILEGEISADGSGPTLGQDPTGTFTTNGIHWLLEQLTEETHRGWIAERWRRMRGQIGDPAFPSPPPPDDLEWLVPFSDVFPYEYDLVVIVDGQLYLAEDQYCLMPGCSCNEATVSLIDVRQTTALGHVRTPVNRPRAATFDGAPVVRELWNALLEQYDPTVLRERFRQIRARVRSRGVSLEADSRSTKVGRNAPCPCGSGKKFKRCCGRAER